MSEKDPLVLTSKLSPQPPRHVLVSRTTFLRQSVVLLSSLSLGIVVVALVMATHDSLWQHGWLLPLVFVLLLLFAGAFFALALHGLWIWSRGDLPLHKEEGARYVTAADGRTIEYFVWGSTKEAATVTVVLHGSTTTGKYMNQFLFPQDVLEQLNVKAISPSFPGHGGSDTQPWRRISEWPKTDLEPILNREGVDQFMVQGSSYGTSHAMATAACFPPTRCIALGLNVPYLPEPICREFNFHTDADMILKESQLQKPWIVLPILSLLSMFQGQIIKSVALYDDAREASKANPEFFEMMEQDVERSFLRGVWGQSLEMLNSATNQYWQDPRTSIKTECVAVWYAEDDCACPAEHGQWLKDLFESKPGVRTDIRCEKKGLGHFSYFGKDDRANAMQTKALLDLLHGRTDGSSSKD